MTSRLAIDGGAPIRERPLPTPPREVGEPELALLREVIESGIMNRMMGTKVAQFEQEFAAFYRMPFAVASTSGTAAIHVAIGALDPDPGSEIVTSPITDLGTIIPILAQNCIPVFADVDLDSMNMDPADLARRITDRTCAILPVHLGGCPCDMDPILAVAEKHGLPVVEDCSQAYCAEYRGRWVGTMGRLGCFSLQQSKHITTGDGGITITADEALADRARKFARKGMPVYSADGSRHYHHFGFNYSMTELQGAVALAQLQRLPTICERRTAHGELLTRLTSGLPGFYPQRVPEGARSTYWFFAARIVEAEAGCSPRRFAEAMRAEGIPTGAHYIGRPIFLYESIRRKQVYGRSHYPWDLQDPAHAVRYEEGECPNCERVLAEMVTLPIHEKFTEADVRDIAAAVEKVISAHQR